MSANPAASFEGDERVRLFCALRLPEQTVERLVSWEGEAFAGVPGVRPVPRESLHVTLAFLGHRPAAELGAIVGALRAACAGVLPPRLAVRGYRETRSVGMLTCDDEGRRAAALAEDLHERLEELGAYERERRRWLPHVTVVRFRERPRLQPELPSLESFVTSDAAAYLSRLRPGGARYEVLESVEVGGR
ncbi:MAG TPA: RNA 2',3'-cyclic phosphodiesterase [Gaiellaceae bacterium]|nr:RNA 2',3'-cyclic phosphodiesterase [Gaiellaceae bacterium]